MIAPEPPPDWIRNGRVRVHLSRAFDPVSYPCPECGGKVVDVGYAGGGGHGFSSELQCRTESCGTYQTIDWYRPPKGADDGEGTGEISLRLYRLGVAHGGDPTLLPRIGDPREGGIVIVGDDLEGQKIRKRLSGPTLWDWEVP